MTHICPRCGSVDSLIRDSDSVLCLLCAWSEGDPTEDRTGPMPQPVRRVHVTGHGYFLKADASSQVAP